MIKKTDLQLQIGFFSFFKGISVQASNTTQQKGSECLLTALDENGKVVSLVDEKVPSVLQGRSRFSRYYCPVCKELMIIKAGAIRIPHFAHRKNSACSSPLFEPESRRHLDGKRHLYQFFLKNRMKASLEYYLPSLKQRPDLFVRDNHSFAVEFQCSTVSPSAIQKRTEGYVSAGIAPIWIYGNLPERTGGNAFAMNDFLWALTRRQSEAGSHLLCYDPAREILFILYHITPSTPRKAFAHVRQFPLKSLKLPLFMNISDKPPFTAEQWQQAKQRWLERKVRFGNLTRDPFLKAVYEAGQNPFLLPHVCGVPVREMEDFSSHATEWQFFIWADCLLKLKAGQRLSLNYIHYRLRERVKSSELSMRILPGVPAINRGKAVEAYMDFLAEEGYVKKTGKNMYIMHKLWMAPKNTEEAQRRESVFYKRLSIPVYPEASAEKNTPCFFLWEQELLEEK